MTPSRLWSYTCPEGEYTHPRLLGLVWAILEHRAWHWRRGDGWVD